MTVLSTLCRLNSLKNIINKKSILKLFQNKDSNAFNQVVRNMSGGEKRTFYITPSKFQYTKFKDDLHFFISLGVIPLTLVILYCNIFIGPATLSEIPEGYDPKPWEYHRHPIKRFFCRTFAEDPQVAYERIMHFLHEEKEYRDWRDTIDKAKKLMIERDDYKGWYFVPSDQGRHYRKARQWYDELEEQKGYR